MTDRAALGEWQDEDAMDSCDDSFCCSMDESTSDDDSLSLHSFDEDMLLNDAKESLPTPASVVCQLIDSLASNCDDFISMELCVPIAGETDFANLLQGLRHNSTVTECTVSSECFQSLSSCQRKELANAILEMSCLKSLTLDSVFPEFLYSCNYCRCWKRDQYYRQYRRYCEFENRTIQELHITHIPSDIVEGLLGHLVMMTVANFASLQRLDMTFAGDFASPQAVLTRLALTALSHSSSLKDVTFGNEDDFGDYNLILEIDTTRTENLMRILKVRCGEEQLCEHSYMEVAQMLKSNSRTLRGLVLDTAVGNIGALTIANTLGQNSNLKALCLGTFDCQDKTKRDGLLSLVSQALTPRQPHGRDRGSSLEYLSLVCQEMDDQGLENISKSFAESRLRELMLFLDNETDVTVSRQGLAALARVFQVNKTIEEFSLICHSLDDEAIMAFSRALKVNTGTLKRLKLHCSKGLNVSSKGYQAIIDMLQTNTTLESLELSRCPGAEDDDDDDFCPCSASEAAHIKYQPEMDFYLSLNKSGVRNLQLNIDTTPKEFCTLLVSQHSNLDTLYYMLSTNPLFIALGA